MRPWWRSLWDVAEPGNENGCYGENPTKRGSHKWCEWSWRGRTVAWEKTSNLGLKFRVETAEFGKSGKHCSSTSNVICLNQIQYCPSSWNRVDNYCSLCNEIDEQWINRFLFEFPLFFVGVDSGVRATDEQRLNCNKVNWLHFILYCRLSLCFLLNEEFPVGNCCWIYFPQWLAITNNLSASWGHVGRHDEGSQTLSLNFLYLNLIWDEWEYK